MACFFLCLKHYIRAKKPFMKYLLVLLLLPLGLHAQVTNQRIYDTIPFIPEHTPQRLAQFAKEPIVTGKIIFLGNSITEMGNWKKVTEDITDRQPSKVFLLIGINDIGKDIPDAVIADNDLKIVKEIHDKSPQTKVYV